MVELQSSGAYFGEHLLAFLDGFVDSADVEEGLFGILVHLAGEDHLESADSLAQGHHHSGEAGKLFSHEEGLGEEALGSAGSAHYEFVVVGELIDTEDGDDILQLIVFLEELLDGLGSLVVLLANDVWIKDAGGRFERIHCG